MKSNWKFIINFKREYDANPLIQDRIAMASSSASSSASTAEKQRAREWFPNEQFARQTVSPVGSSKGK